MCTQNKTYRNTSVSFSVGLRRGKKVGFPNPTFAQVVHVEEVEHELGPRGRLGSHRRSKKSLRNRMIPNRHELRIAPGRLSGGGKGPQKSICTLKEIGYTYFGIFLDRAQKKL